MSEVLLWIVLAAMTAGALAVVLGPLVRARAPDPVGNGEAERLYRDQLAELAADLERGQVAPAEAEAARAEIARRLLRSGITDGERRTAEGAALPKRLMLASAAAVAVGAAAAYALLGSPGLPGQPLAERAGVPLERQGVEDLVAQVERRLSANPEDGMGWSVVAPVYLRLGRAEEAADAYERAIRLLGETPDRLEGLGEASVVAANGIVGETARKAFAAALAKDPGRPKSRFFLAVAAEQDGRLDEARSGYAKLLAEAPAEAAELRSMLEGRLAAVGGGPSQADMAAAETMPSEEREAMIRGMVEGLAEKLKADGRNLEGWVRLARSYAVLGEKAKAEQALSDARKAMQGDAKAAAELDALARSLGLGS